MGSGTQATRIGRHSETNRIYHVVTGTCDRHPCFRDFHLGRIVVHVLREQHLSGSARTLAFVLMPDHLHWLFELGSRHSLSRVVNEVKSRSAIRINRRAGRSGPVWQKGFYDRAIRAEDDLPSVARYIVMNPVRSKIVRSISEYALWDAMWLEL